MKNVRPKILGRGFSLVEVLVVLAILGIVGIVYSKMNTNNMRATKNISLHSDLLAIKRTIFAATSCSRSFVPGTTCNAAGQIVPLLREDGSTLVSSSGRGSKMGEYTLRAECNADQAGLIVRASRLSPSGHLRSTQNAHFRQDPLTKKRAKWSDNRSILFPIGTNICPSGGGRSEWVKLDCERVEYITGGWNCIPRGNISPTQICKDAGYAYATGNCRHDNVMERPGLPDYSMWEGEGTFNAHVRAGGLDYWAITCLTYGFQLPDEILCL